MINFKPLGNQVVVELDAVETVRSGIILPQTKDRAPVSGTVVAVGGGKQLMDGVKYSMETKVGDKVLFGKFAGSEMNYQDKIYVVMSEEDIMAVVEEKTNEENILPNTIVCHPDELDNFTKILEESK